MLIAKDDPRRLMRAGDLEKAYPQHAVYEAHKTEIDAILGFLHALPRDLRLCEERDSFVGFDEDDAEITEKEWNPLDHYSHRVQDMVLKHVGIDVQAWWREKDAMLDFLREVQTKKPEGVTR